MGVWDGGRITVTTFSEVYVPYAGRRGRRPPYGLDNVYFLVDLQNQVQMSTHKFTIHIHNL